MSWRVSPKENAPAMDRGVCLNLEFGLADGDGFHVVINVVLVLNEVVSEHFN